MGDKSGIRAVESLVYPGEIFPSRANFGKAMEFHEFAAPE